MSGVIERAARALYAKRHDTNVGVASYSLAVIPWDDLDEARRAKCRAEVRAVLESLRDPTPEMLAAGQEAVSACYSLEPGEGFDEDPAEAAYRAMIDAVCGCATADKPGSRS